MIIIGNGTLLANTAEHAVTHNGAVAVSGGLIQEVGETAALRAKFPGHEFIDAKGGLIMPGLVNTHHHFYSALARGMMIKKPKVSKNFNEILENLWWKIDKALTLEDVRLSAETTMADSIKCGVTTIVDHHASFGAITGSLDTIADSALSMGVRACLCFEVSDRCGKEAALESIAENKQFLKRAKAHKEGMLAGLFGLHASFTLCDETLKASKEAAGDAGFHVHVAEGAADVEDCLHKYGMRVVERLERFGILGPKTLAVHCIHVNEAEMQTLARTNTTVLHNPQSNMSNAVGCSPLLALNAHGIRLGIGTDGYTNCVLESAKAAGVLQRHHLADPSVAWGEPYTFLRQNNPRIAGEMFGTRLGELAPGAAADIIIVDYDPLTPLMPENIAGHMHFGLYGPLVHTSMINGKLVMRNRQLLTIDEQAMRAKSRELASNLWEKL